ncbi:MAG: DUF1636 domain-containing protein [Pseudomonadota bacterium]
MNHRITVCTSCRHTNAECPPGYDLIEKLSQAFGTREGAGCDSFEVSGVACMAGCDRPCTVAYHATAKATYLFGDVDPTTDIDDLVRFAERYASLHDGWCAASNRPGKLRTATLARVPAAMIRSEQSGVLAS